MWQICWCHIKKKEKHFASELGEISRRESPTHKLRSTYEPFDLSGPWTVANKRLFQVLARALMGPTARIDYLLFFPISRALLRRAICSIFPHPFPLISYPPPPSCIYNLMWSPRNVINRRRQSPARRDTLFFQLQISPFPCVWYASRTKQSSYFIKFPFSYFYDYITSSFLCRVNEVLVLPASIDLVPCAAGK